LLRGKVRILIQRGRFARPRRIPLIAGILDQFVREIDFDENKQSWHPKVSIVEFANGSGASDWRLWLGSRNLTAAVNRDFGLLLNSTADLKADNASPVPGVGGMVQRLAEYADLKSFRPSALRTALNAVRWTHPDRFRVERITLTGGQGADKGPVPPQDLDEVIAISPFLDGGVVRAIGGWGGARTHRFLLSTELALTKIAGQAGKPLSGFKDNLFVLDMPAPELVEPSASVSNDGGPVEEDETEELPVGLHAKIFSARKGKQLHLWVGSANATSRAWTGANVEVIAEITAPASIQEGLMTLLTRPVSAAALEAREPPPEETAADRLDEAGKHCVAAWNGKLERDGSLFRLACGKPPHPVDAGFKVEAGLATGALIEWPRGTLSLTLGEYAPSLHTELVQFRLSSGEISCAWLQRVEVTPEFEPDRDRYAIARHLGMSAFLAWIAALMAGEEGGDGGDLWDTPPEAGRKQENGALFNGSILTLDAMLACWARDPAAFKRVGQRINAYLGPVLAQAGTMPSDDLKRLHAFQTVWETVSQELLKDR